ncbi:MAG TPA: autotransporter-associated beta strand repeat-containing protein, partial [Opitutaceae bacterium]
MVWTGNDSNGFGDVSNWSTPPLFDGTDQLAFELSGSTDVTSMVGGSYSITSLAISGTGSASLLISSCSGNLQVSSSVTDSASGQVTIAVPISGCASLSVTSGGYLILNGANSYNGGTTIACMSTLQLGDGSSTGSIINAVADNGTLVFNNPGCFSFSNGISGSGAVTVQSGMVTLGGSNTYSGTTTVEGCASLTDAESHSLSACSAINLLDHAALNVNYCESIKSLEGDSCTSVNLASGANLLVNTGGCMEFGGVISGCGSLEIGNGATQILVNANTYGGGTTIDCSATLQLGDGSSSGSITGSVTDNGTL